MQYAEIEWQNDQAESKQFGDIFFSRLGGLEESRHIFIALNNLDKRFQESEDFRIAELGFGTGLNFLLAWKLWIERAPKNTKLHYVSTELFPMRAEDMRHALALWPEIVPFSEELISNLPLAIEGVHRIHFAQGRVSLTLLYGDAQDTLSKLEILNNKFDCWFLDGFSPQKNPLMWEQSLIRSISSLTKQGGTFATYSVAGFLRRALIESGWQIEKVAGFAHKREALKGTLTTLKTETSFKPQAPWFSLKKIENKKSRSAIVIGGGLAGCWSAYCLAREGIEVTLIERESKLASQASGNHAALSVPYLSLEKNARQRFYISAFDYNRRELDYIEKIGAYFERNVSGAIHQLPKARISSLVSRFESLSIPAEIARQHSDEALFYSKAGSLRPEILCRALTALFPDLITLKLETEALSLSPDENKWELVSENLKIKADVAVIANSYDALQFSQTNWMPLTKVRGELVLVEDKKPKRYLQNALCGNSYVIPLSEKDFLIGASYNQVFLDPAPCHEIQSKLFEQSQSEFAVFSEHAKIISSRVAFRASTYDRMPYVGPVPDISRCLESYKDYKKGFPPESFADCDYLPGLYVNLGHGSRGVVSTPLCAEIVSSFVSNSPLPIENDLLPFLLPMRWVIRELARSKELRRGLKSEAEF